MGADTEISNEKIGQEIDGPGRTYFDDVVTDNIMDALLELSATVWTYRDRLYVLERVLEDKGIDVGAMVEAYEPTPEDVAERREMRQEMVNRVFHGFSRRPK